MEKRKQLLKKLVIGVAAVLLAAGCTLVIKDLLAMRNPPSALPEMIVRYDINTNETILPTQHSMRVAYKWRFLNVIKEEEVDRSEWQVMEYATLLPNTEMQFGFSYDCKDVKVSVAKARDDGRPPSEDDFVPMLVVAELPDYLPEEGQYFITADNCFQVPNYVGKYIYKVEASWGVRGSVLYYYKIEVLERG